MSNKKDKMEMSKSSNNSKSSNQSKVTPIAAAPVRTVTPVVTPVAAAKTSEGSKQGSHEAVLKSAVDIRNKLIVEWNKGPNSRNFAVFDDLLDSAKVLLTKLKYLPLENKTSEKELAVARDILEIGTRVSVAEMGKTAPGTEIATDEFDRYIAQLKQYYFDLKQPSDSMYEILGMNLVKLLSQNRIAEFHVELELFIHPDAKVVLSNVYIRKAVEVEQYLTEGRYNKILALHSASAEDLKKGGLISSGFRYFIERVIENSRSVIAEVIEKAFDKLQITDATKFLHSGADPTILQKLSQEHQWVIRDGFVYFSNKQGNQETLSSHQLLNDVLTYAKELDTIV